MDPSGSFSIDRHSGVLTLVSGLDREKTDSIRLEISALELETSMVAANERPSGANVTVNIDVEDVNDNDPVFEPGNLNLYFLLCWLLCWLLNCQKMLIRD
jgi:hypothetical protein